MNIDPNTGLPQLPENQFWRVAEDGILDEPYVLLMRRRKWWSPAIIDSMQVHSGWNDENKAHLDRVTCASSPQFNAENIRMTAERILDNLEMKQRRNETYRANSELIGDYPPKKLDTPITIQEGQ